MERQVRQDLQVQQVLEDQSALQAAKDPLDSQVVLVLPAHLAILASLDLPAKEVRSLEKCAYRPQLFCSFELIFMFEEKFQFLTIFILWMIGLVFALSELFILAISRILFQHPQMYEIVAD